MNFQVLKLDLEKAREPEIILPTSAGSSKKQKSSRKTSVYTKAFDCVDHNKLGNSSRDGIPDLLDLRNLYAGKKATFRTGHGTTDWFQIGKGVCHGCIYNLYADYIMRNAGLEEAHAEIKIARRIINNLRYADDITVMADSEEELKSLLMKVKKRVKKLA